jgi:hypothetical protein
MGKRSLTITNWGCYKPSHLVKTWHVRFNCPKPCSLSRYKNQFQSLRLVQGGALRIRLALLLCSLVVIFGSGLMLKRKTRAEHQPAYLSSYLKLSGSASRRDL